MTFSRRHVLAALGAGLLAAPARAQSRPTMLIHKDPDCDCCLEWSHHVRDAGFSVTIKETSDLRAIRARRRIPLALAGCHTADIEGYVIEGHVPAPEIIRLLAERPHALGLAVPGMPIGSPGMEISGSAPETYAVVLFGAGQGIYARYRGTERL
ncbi:DUF411 domain-containing protein [uncultured Alsobacter sp.]|uniref:DUF411 domain-containing protein n=1 Tax=uncultured Alsobacter sp. TaxID=1748258 RepID=UPI0025EF55EC|nr:DUF411 domain-containing protein [uncultured Alsobacter sp.]